MRKPVWQRLLAVLLCALLLTAVPLPVFAEEDELPGSPDGGPVITKIEMTVEGPGGGPDETEDIAGEAAEALGGISDSPAYGSPANAAVESSMYSYLTTRQKACYKVLEGISIDSIASAPLQGSFRTVQCQISGISNAALEGRIAGGSFLPANTAAQAAYKSLNNDLSAAVVALRYDRPDLLWLDGSVTYGIYLSWYPGSSRVTVSSAYYGFPLLYSGKEKSMRNLMMQEAQKIADTAKAQPDTYSKLKAAHDLLAERSTYNHVTSSQLEEYLSHSAYSALVGGDAYEPVCDGYSKAMKLVCDLLGIPCLCVSSSTHMWNNVKMDDGLWYNLDLTWDDGLTSSVVDTYFLVGSQTIAQGIQFDTMPAHKELNPFLEARVTVPGGMPYPTKSKTAYIYLGEDYPPLRFPDVTRADWYYDAVETVAELGYFKGDEFGNFLPRKNITRAEFAAVMANVQGADLSGYRGNGGFTDVSSRAWYAGAVVWAKNNGLMQGNGTRFRPGDPITRQEICQVLFNFDEDLQAFGFGGAFFEDDANIATWAWQAVYACNEAGLVLGDNNRNFNPLSNAMRCETATILSRLSELG